MALISHKDIASSYQWPSGRPATPTWSTSRSLSPPCSSSSSSSHFWDISSSVRNKILLHCTTMIPLLIVKGERGGALRQLRINNKTNKNKEKGQNSFMKDIRNTADSETKLSSLSDWTCGGRWSVLRNRCLSQIWYHVSCDTPCQEPGRHRQLLDCLHSRCWCKYYFSLLLSTFLSVSLWVGSHNHIRNLISHQPYCH